MPSRPSARLAAAATLALVGSSPALAIPLVYQCKIVDYTPQGAVVTEFQYTQVGTFQRFESEQSAAHVYLDENHRLTLSLRPVAGAEPSFYSTTTAFDLPKRVEVVLARGDELNGYAARLACLL